MGMVELATILLRDHYQKPRRDHGQQDQKHLSTKQITKDIKIHNVKKLRGEIIT